MSFAAMAWAINQPVGNTTAKFVLLMVASYADEEGRAWPSQEKLAEDIEGSRHTVMRALEYLEAEKLLTRERRHRTDGTRSSDHLQLNLSRKMLRSKKRVTKSQIATADTITEPIRTITKGGDVVVSTKGHSQGRASKVPDDFSPDDTVIQLARTLGIDLVTVLPCFLDHHRAKGSVMKDWQAALRTWLRNEIKFNRRPSNAATTGPQRPINSRQSNFELIDQLVEEAERRQSAAGW